jgi:hypothetical protein
MIAAMLCREFKWTYQEYRNQPTWFIRIITAMLSEEARANEKRQKKANG